MKTDGQDVVDGLRLLGVELAVLEHLDDPALSGMETRTMNVILLCYACAVGGFLLGFLVAALCRIARGN